MNRLNPYIILFLSLGVLSAVCIFSPEARAVCVDECQNQFDFAEALFEENDFYRAITEYKRFIFLFSENSALYEKAHFRICESYFKAKRWEETVSSCKEFITRHPHSALLNDVYYLRGRAEKELKKYDDALSSFEMITRSYSEKFRNKGYYQIALVYIDLEKWERAREYFSMISDNSTLYASADLFASGLENIDKLPKKSPALAGTLAAIIPGSGHLYTERPRDAMVAFLLNGAFIWAAVELFEDDNYVAGGVVTFFEVGWYAGNIYSAVSSAHKYNKAIKNEFIQGLKERGNVSYYFDQRNAGHLLMLSFNY